MISANASASPLPVNRFSKTVSVRAMTAFR
jgi:hypothetical protein